MYQNFIDILKVFTVFQILLVCAFLFLHSERKSKRNLFLASFILSKALFIADSLFISYYALMLPVAPNAIMIGTWFQLILGPALYFTIIVTTQREFTFKAGHLLHLLPFLCLQGFMLAAYQFSPFQTKLQMLQGGFPYSAPWSRLLSCGIYIHFAIYGIMALGVLSRAREENKSYSSQSIEKNVAYLKFLIYDFVVVWGINCVTMYVPIGWPGWVILQTITVLNIFFIANAIVYQGLKFPHIFHTEGASRQKYEKNPLTDREKDIYSARLRAHMIAQKPYLNPTLSLTDLATQLAMPPYILSQVLNVLLKQNFYDFVNGYRIEESKQLFSQALGNGATVLKVLYQSGFNSKSVFNTAFKKHTGMTPSEFKKTLLSQQQSPPLSSVLS